MIQLANIKWNIYHNGIYDICLIAISAYKTDKII
jgi:hypothetical protein